MVKMVVICTILIVAAFLLVIAYSCLVIAGEWERAEEQTRENFKKETEKRKKNEKRVYSNCG